jgi:hypothetical protein
MRPAHQPNTLQDCRRACVWEQSMFRGSFFLSKMDHLVLLASCPRSHECPGGLLALRGEAVEYLDTCSSTGLCYSDGRLFRLLWADGAAPGPAGVLAYDASGVAAAWTLGGLQEPHDIAWTGTNFLIVSTGTNDILRVSPAGQVTGRWHAPGTGDAWHLNNLLLHHGRILVSGFGRFSRHREWTQLKTTGTGMVFDLATGQDVLSGLACPHNPRWLDGDWLVCNSAMGEVLQVNAQTAGVRRRLQFPGWTRGVAMTDDYLIIGVSARRNNAWRRERGGIAVVCRRTWALLAYLPLPCREVYDLLLVPAGLAEGVRRGREETAAAAEPVGIPDHALASGHLVR